MGNKMKNKNEKRTGKMFETGDESRHLKDRKVYKAAIWRGQTNHH